MDLSPMEGFRLDGWLCYDCGAGSEPQGAAERAALVAHKRDFPNHAVKAGWTRISASAPIPDSILGCPDCDALSAQGRACATHAWHPAERA